MTPDIPAPPTRPDVMGETPPSGLRARILAGAHDVRPAGRSALHVPDVSPIEAYRRAAARLADVLAELSSDEWHRPALRDLTVQGLAGHLVAVEQDLQLALTDQLEPTEHADHIARSQERALAAQLQEPDETRTAWLHAAATNEQLARTTDLLNRDVTFHGMTLPLSELLVVRAFELWTHEEDIRRATGRELRAPDAAVLQLMTRLAVAVLPIGLERAGRPLPARTLRVVLTGPGGGTWQVRLDVAGGRQLPLNGTTPTRIVLGAVQFCRLAADRVTVDELDCDVAGDADLATAVLEGARHLAWD